MMLGTRQQGPASLRLSKPNALPLHMRGQVVELSALHVEPDARGQGAEHSLMLATTVEADLAKRFLFIQVEPADDCDMSKGQLASFYHRHGFQPIQVEPLLMVRPCLR